MREVHELADTQNIRPVVPPVLPDVVHPAVIRSEIDRELSLADTSMDTQDRAAVNNDGDENITPTENIAEGAVEPENTPDVPELMNRGKEQQCLQQ